MSRKIGLGDTYFDPDINGDIDFDFFGGANTDSTDGRQLVAYNAKQLPRHEAESVASASINTLTSQRRATIVPNNFYSMGDDTPLDRRPENHQMAAVNTELRISLERYEKKKYDESMNMVFVNGDGGGGENLLSIQEGMVGQRNPENVKLSAKQTDERISLTHIQTYRSHDESKGEMIPDPVTFHTPASKEDDDDDEEEDDDDDDDDSASDLYSLTDDDEYEDSGDEDDNDDDVEVNEEDLDSDITEVSPLSSANMSPLPESPKRTPEPKAKRLSNLLPSPKLGELRRSELSTRCSTSSSSCSSTPRDSMRSPNKHLGTNSRSHSSHYHKPEAVDLKVLTKAIMELEEERRRHSSMSSCGHQPSLGHKPYVKPRKNMTFTNDEVRRIDLENKRLLRKIIDCHRPRKHPVPATGRVASSAVNRLREHKKIETENLVIHLTSPDFFIVQKLYYDDCIN